MLLIFNFIVIISINNNCFIILSRKPRTDACDKCTRLHTAINLQSNCNILDNPEALASLKLELDLHQTEADLQKAMLTKEEKDGPEKKKKSEWRTVCTGK